MGKIAILLIFLIIAFPANSHVEHYKDLNLIEFDINMIIQNCNSKRKKVLNLFYNFLENKNYNDYIIQNNLDKYKEWLEQR